jgi:hypothetical protein
MSSDLDKSGEGTETVGQKLDTLSASVDKRFDTLTKRFDTLTVSVDERFDAVDVALIEQRQYTEFAFDRLADEVRTGFEAVNGRLDGADGRFNRLERKLDQFIDTQSRANQLVERRLTALEPRSGQE